MIKKHKPPEKVEVKCTKCGKSLFKIKTDIPRWRGNCRNCAKTKVNRSFGSSRRVSGLRA